jgi:transcriptional regulator with XRE-family HTH domain
MIVNSGVKIRLFTSGGKANMVMTAGEVDAHVGRQMRMRRESLGISQGRLGRHLGLTFSQVQKYEKGTNRIGAGRLYLLARFLGVPVGYFYEGLEEGTEAKATGRVGDADMHTLDNAFLSIPDPDTRRSVLALVCSLAGTPGAGVERRTVG